MQAQNSTIGILDNLLVEFTNLFMEHLSLPPSRACDHHIPLITLSWPIIVSPYRYINFQKDEIEKEFDRCYNKGSFSQVDPHSLP